MYGQTNTHMFTSLLFTCALAASATMRVTRCLGRETGSKNATYSHSARASDENGLNTQSNKSSLTLTPPRQAHGRQQYIRYTRRRTKSVAGSNYTHTLAIQLAIYKIAFALIRRNQREKRYVYVYAIYIRRTTEMNLPQVNSNASLCAQPNK